MRLKKGTTMEKIAREAGVSITTVSRALNNLPKVDKKVQLRIMNIAERLGYNRFTQSRKLDAAKRSMKFIVLIFGRISSHLRESIEIGIDQQLRRTNYYELRYMIDEKAELESEAKKELFLKNIISEKGVVGIISAFVQLSDVFISNLYKNNLPVVLLNNYTEFGKCVTINNIEASYQAVKKFIELGRRKIGCIMPHEQIAQVWADRITGYKKALSEENIAFDPDLIVYEDSFIIRQAGIHTEILIDKHPDVDAILYGGDQQAYGGMKMLQELGKRIPEDIAVIGFDDIDTNTVIQPSLSSIKQPMYEMGREGIKMLLNSIENYDFSHEEIILKPELILRKSCLSDYQDEQWR